ncbi:MAG: hypothetical protein P8Z81_13430, partial [Deinococcales bacterium]
MSLADGAIEDGGRHADVAELYALVRRTREVVFGYTAELPVKVLRKAHEMDRVDLGAVVTLQDSGSKEAFEVQVVSPVEAGVLEG